jgi:hypothetical protein
VRTPSNKQARKELKEKQKARQFEGRTVSPYPQSFDRTPKNLVRQATTQAQRNFIEDTIVWGQEDAFPLKLAQAVQRSPAASACISTRSQFIKGSGFTDKTLMKQKVNETDTLWSLHCKLSDILALFRGFAVNLKFNGVGEITKVYDMAFESIRFVKPADDLNVNIDRIKYNPYFGTKEFQKKYTKEYCLYDKEGLASQIESMRDTFPGQVYYYGRTSPLFRFYPMPEYWSAEKWIEIDGKIQEFHAENLDNGFFQSVLMNIIGDPNQPSKNPKYVVTETVNGQTVQRSTKTVGEEFSEMMSEQFSGAKKAGNVMALWSLNQDQAAKVNAFPNNTNADLFTTLQDLTTKNITIATKTPSILANISEGVSLGSAGSEIQKAIELMQATVVEDQHALMDFYNDILLPGMGIAARVELVNYSPVTITPEIDDKVFEWLNDEEKAEWVKKAYPNITIKRTFAATTPAPTSTPGQPLTEEQPTPAPAPPTGNSALANLGLAKLNKVQKLVLRYNLGLTDPSNPKALTYEQAKQLLMAEGFTEQEMDAWLVKPEELEE